MLAAERPAFLQSKRLGVFMPSAMKESAAPFVPEERILPVLREAAASRGCELYRDATCVCCFRRV